ncbi:DUF3941 domain-containing protein [Peribacillus cavernae]|uniref:DUF3941 domain-containing protein n=1 Tax=Peribacillus cavernae TaxID=1674310 RepID=A0A3S0VDW2_9BACI|nr:DUF3941 domain-containing protein [Peribacillus cavernae]MDQ0217557.1 hypothetical protein [Peribacillus cavernae]RUQ30008.1 DUF3941 domain-containing protein [Peribacillus cavernae]
MTKTTDDDKKPKDNQSINEQRNMVREKNRQAGKHSFSKKTDHK